MLYCNITRLSQVLQQLLQNTDHQNRCHRHGLEHMHTPFRISLPGTASTLMLLVLIFGIFQTSQAKANSNVVVTLSPVHSITSAIMKGVTDPQLLIDKQSSAHHLSLRPSQARMLQNAELVIRVSSALESFLDETLQAMGDKSRLLTLAGIDTSFLLAVRQPLMSAPLGSQGSQGSQNLQASDTKNVKNSNELKQTDGAHFMDSRAIDTHLWMNPQIVIQWINPIALELSHLDPDNSERYQLNASRLIQRLNELDKHIANSVADIEKPVLVVYHDSYQYFEKHYGLRSVAALHDHADNRVGARSLQALFKQLDATETQSQKTQERYCLLVPPTQLEAGIVSQLTDKSRVQIVETDVLGWHLKPGPDLYFEMMQELADGLSACAS